jgi:hypothetical protein
LDGSFDLFTAPDDRINTAFFGSRHEFDGETFKRFFLFAARRAFLGKLLAFEVSFANRRGRKIVVNFRDAVRDVI